MKLALLQKWHSEFPFSFDCFIDIERLEKKTAKVVKGNKYELNSKNGNFDFLSACHKIYNLMNCNQFSSNYLEASLFIAMLYHLY